MARKKNAPTSLLITVSSEAQQDCLKFITAPDGQAKLSINLKNEYGELTGVYLPDIMLRSLWENFEKHYPSGKSFKMPKGHLSDFNVDYWRSLPTSQKLLEYAASILAGQVELILKDAMKEAFREVVLRTLVEMDGKACKLTGSNRPEKLLDRLIQVNNRNLKQRIRARGRGRTERFKSKEHFRAELKRALRIMEFQVVVNYPNLIIKKCTVADEMGISERQLDRLLEKHEIDWETMKDKHTPKPIVTTDGKKVIEFKL